MIGKTDFPATEKELLSLKVLLGYLQLQTRLTIDHKERRLGSGELFQVLVPGSQFQNCRYQAAGLEGVLQSYFSSIFT